MKQSIIALILCSLLSACQTSSENPYPASYEPPGEVAFGPLAGVDRKHYLLEQQALINSQVQARGVTSEITGPTLIVNIPGNIAFDINAAQLNWNVHDLLDKIAPVLKEYKYTSILVIGHSDGRGNRDLNQLLSEQRARLIREYFINSGLDVQRITSKGVGGNDLLISDELTTLERSLNRRITLEIAIDEALVAADSKNN